MKINPIGVNYQQRKQQTTKLPVKNQTNVQFEGKHKMALFFGGVAGGLGTLGALSGIAIMTGGISLIPTIAYGSFCAGIGAFFGNGLDKAQSSDKKKD